MKSIYLFTPGVLKRKDNTLVIENDKGRKFLPVESIEDIKVFSDVEVNKKTLEFLSKKKIIVHFFDFVGKYFGSFYPIEFNLSGEVFLNQCAFYSDSIKRADIAKRFIYGEMLNLLAVLKENGNNSHFSSDELKSYGDKLAQSNDVDKLMLIEANFRESYYRAFDKIVSSKIFKFENRSKQPPLNEINSLISFGNTMVYSDMLKNIFKSHLDPRVGFLHSTNGRSFSLNLDLAEIFKPLIIDRIIVSAVKSNLFLKSDFHPLNNGIYLNTDGKKKFVGLYDDLLSHTVFIDHFKRNVSYKSLMLHEVYKIEKHVMSVSEYIPYSEL